jgi:Uma2 family endonuclease
VNVDADQVRPFGVSMTTIINDRDLERALIRRRRRLGHDRRDEVWNGVYVMSPFPANRHQRVVGCLDTVFRLVVESRGQGIVLPGANISDREDDWKKNYRIPDCCVFLNGTLAQDRDTHWFGGPDFCVEIASPGERVQDKLPFYASVGTREVLLILRAPHRLQLMRLQGTELVSAGESTADDPTWLESTVVPLAFRLWNEPQARVIEVRRTDEPGSWTIPLG